MKLTGDDGSTRRKTCPSAALFTTKPTWTSWNGTLSSVVRGWQLRPCFRRKFYRKSKHILFSVTFSRKPCLSWDNVGNWGRAGQVTDAIIIWRMRLACWMTKATGTYSEYVILVAFPWQQWLRERACDVIRTMPVLCDVYMHVKSNMMNMSRQNGTLFGLNSPSYSVDTLQHCSLFAGSEVEFMFQVQGIFDRCLHSTALLCLYSVWRSAGSLCLYSLHNSADPVCLYSVRSSADPVCLYSVRSCADPACLYSVHSCADPVCLYSVRSSADHVCLYSVPSSAVPVCILFAALQVISVCILCATLQILCACILFVALQILCACILFHCS